MPYYGTLTCGARIATIKFMFYPNPSDVQNAVLSHHIDLATAGDVTQLRQAGLSVEIRPAPLLEHLELNHDATHDGKSNPLANEAVRLALALAVDKGAVIQRGSGFDATTARTLEASTFLLNRRELHQPYADLAIKGQWDPIAWRYMEPGSHRALADAKTLLAGTSFAGGFELEAYTTQNNPARAQELSAIAQSWAQLGVHLLPEYLSPVDLYGPSGRVSKGDFQVALFAVGGGVDPDHFKYSLSSRYDPRLNASSLLSQNFAGVHNSAIDRTFDRAAVTFDQRARAAAYARVQRQVNRHADWIPLFFRPETLVSDGRIGNLSTVSWNMALWRLKGN
jgi:ABC-type transport system substrate-binding protein